AALRWEDVPEPVRERARVHVLDHVVCAVDGSRAELAARLRSVLSASAADTAFLDGTCAFVHNYSDTSFATLLHGEAVVVPAALAQARQLGAPVRAALPGGGGGHGGG